MGEIGFETESVHSEPYIRDRNDRSFGGISSGRIWTGGLPFPAGVGCTKDDGVKYGN